MGRTLNSAQLTKSFIESKVSQIQIMSKYLNIPIDVIQECVTKNKLIKSVFRDDDENGSMGFAYNQKGKLKVRDFGGTCFFGDIYDVVGYVMEQHYNKPINPSIKSHFYAILVHISRTFKDIIYGKEKDEELDGEIAISIKPTTNKAIIDIVSRNWNNADVAYWDRLNVSVKHLNSNFVIPVNQYFINRKDGDYPKYTYDKKDPCYAYIIGKNRNNILLVKLYFPYRNRAKQIKFITNSNVLEGLLNLELDNYDYIIITKSSKDRLSLGSYIHNLFYGGLIQDRIGVINVPSENYKLKEHEYSYLKSKLSSKGLILSLFDFDYTGRVGARYLKTIYNIPYLFITNGMFGLADYKSKDFTDLHTIYNKEKIKEFILKTLEYVELNKPRYVEESNVTDQQRLLYNELPY